jgi:hypothetical protein
MFDLDAPVLRRHEQYGATWLLGKIFFHHHICHEVPLPPPPERYRVFFRQRINFNITCSTWMHPYYDATSSTARRGLWQNFFFTPTYATRCHCPPPDANGWCSTFFQKQRVNNTITCSTWMHPYYDATSSTARRGLWQKFFFTPTYATRCHCPPPRRQRVVLDFFFKNNALTTQ